MPTASSIFITCARRFSGGQLRTISSGYSTFS